MNKGVRQALVTRIKGVGHTMNKGVGYSNAMDKGVGQALVFR